MVREFREADRDTPLVLMGYLNPILAYGPEQFCADAGQSGVDGLIVVDLPSEEADWLSGSAETNGLDIIRLVAPTTDDARLQQVLEGSSGFVYYVSITGITGTRSASAEGLKQPFRASVAPPICRLRSASACARPSRRLRPCTWRTRRRRIRADRDAGSEPGRVQPSQAGTGAPSAGAGACPRRGCAWRPGCRMRRSSRSFGMNPQ